MAMFVGHASPLPELHCRAPVAGAGGTPEECAVEDGAATMQWKRSFPWTQQLKVHEAVAGKQHAALSGFMHADAWRRADACAALLAAVLRRS